MDVLVVDWSDMAGSRMGYDASMEPREAWSCASLFVHGIPLCRAIEF